MMMQCPNSVVEKTFVNVNAVPGVAGAIAQ